jgi:hypothetical protein
MASSYCKQCFKPYANVQDAFTKLWCDDCESLRTKAGEALKTNHPEATPDEVLEAGRTAMLQGRGHSRQTFINPKEFNRFDRRPA